MGWRAISYLTNVDTPYGQRLPDQNSIEPSNVNPILEMAKLGYAV